MNTQKVQLEISNDIFDKVISFLENLPKNKIQLNFETVFNQKSSKVEETLIFGDFLKHTQRVSSITKFDRDELHER